MKNLVIPISLVLTLTACGGIKKEAKYPTGADRASTETTGIYEEAPTIWGKGGSLLNPDGDKKNTGEGITVNSFLWRAAIDTISFMPLASADPFGGTIITDWYTDPNTPNEKIKLNVFVLGKELKASAIKVTVFRQVNGIDTPANAETGRKLEDTILTRARQLRIAKIEEE